VKICEEHLSVVNAVANEVSANLERAPALRRSILRQAFEGKLVPQDPTDEPASRLLERLRTDGSPKTQNGIARRKPRAKRNRTD